MKNLIRRVWLFSGILLLGLTIPAMAQEQAVGEPSTAATDAAGQAQAALDAKFKEYKDALREIEKLRTEFQTAAPARRKALNEQLTGHVAHAQSLVNGLVDAAKEAYRFAPNANRQITDLLSAVAQHDVVGWEVEGPPVQGSGGDQYEKALPIIRLLSEGDAEIPDLPVWGFLSAFVGNDFDLASQYLQQAQEAGAFQEASSTTDPAKRRMMDLATSYAQMVDKYRAMWATESKLREAEAAADDLPRVKLTTSKGEITLELFENQAPQAVANFITLVKQGYYDGTPFHRVIAGFMAQGGAKQDDGTGGPSYTIRCECNKPDARKHFRGSLSMAHRGKDTGNSQFFLTVVPTTHLDDKHTVFGRVVDGMEVLGDLTRREPIHNPQQDAQLPKPDRIIKAEVLRDRGHEYAFERIPDLHERALMGN